MKEQQLIDRIRSLAPMMEAHALEAERQRRPVDAVMAAVEETGAYRYFVPKRFGGFEFSLEGFMDVGIIMGEADLSTAWVVAFCMEHNWLLGLYNREAQEDLFGKQPYIIAPGALAPKGQAKPVEGGFRVTGHWEWGTGVMHADWVLVGALSENPESGNPELCMYAIPIDEVEVIDTWHMAGMVGTGSNDIAVHDVFVPAHRRQNVMDMRAGDSPGAIWHDSPTYKMPMLPVLGLTAAAPAVGCARKMVELYRQRLNDRVVYGTNTKQADRGVSQARLGHVAIKIQNAEARLRELARETMGWGERGEICPELERANLRLRIAHVVRQARDVVGEVVEASGAHAHFLANPLQRALRDLNTLSCHTVFDLDVGGELYGRMLLGLPPNSPV